VLRGAHDQRRDRERVRRLRPRGVAPALHHQSGVRRRPGLPCGRRRVRRLRRRAAGRWRGLTAAAKAVGASGRTLCSSGEAE
jgi:hypothetical protein